MRKYLMVVVAAIISALAITSFAQADDIQSITAKLTPAKRDKKKFKPAQIYVEILTGPNTGDPTNPEQPPSATNTKVNFPKNAKFDQKAVPKCKGTATQLQANTTTARRSRSAATSRSSARARNDPDRSRAHDGYLGLGHGRSARCRHHARRPGRRDRVQRPREEHAVPALPGRLGQQHHGPRRQAEDGQEGPEGLREPARRDDPAACWRGAITRFTTTVKNGKYVQARCKTKNEKWQATTIYTNHPKTTDDYTTTCKQK